MRNPSTYRALNGTETAFAAGAAPKTLNGSTLRMNTVGAGLAAVVVANARTTSLTIAGKWQGSDDNTNWFDVVPMNNAATVVQVTGTGSDVASTKIYEAPQCLYGFRFARFQLVTAAAAADGTNDKGKVSYRYLVT